MILITGATGHLGNVLVRELIAAGKKIRVLVLPGEPMLSLQGMLTEVVVGDILNREDLRKAMQGIETVYNLAGVIAIRPGMEEIMHRVNVEGARNVAEIAREQGVNRMIHVSSVHAFRREPHGTVMDETTPLALDSPAGTYDRTKAEGTKAVLEQVGKGLDAVIACPSGIIGLHDYLDSEIGKALAHFADCKMGILVEGAFDFVDVRDVARGLILACEKGARGEIYIFSGTRATIEDLYHMTRQESDKNTPAFKVPTGLALFAMSIVQNLFQWLKISTRYTVYSLQTLTDNSNFSSQKAFRELGYRPRPLAEAVADFLAWHRLRQKSKGQKVKPDAGKAGQKETLRNIDHC